MSKKHVRITHRPSGELIAEGPVGWAITPFEGNWYVGVNHLRTNGFRTTAFPGLCFYKFIYMWVDFQAKDGSVSKHLAWKYVVPNPLFPFIMFRVAVSGHHPELQIDVTEAAH
jgi:uncharacterized protein (DUF427 family)